MSHRWSGKANASGSRRLVGKINAHQQVTEGLCLGPQKVGLGKSQTHPIVCQEKMSVGKEIYVGKENVGRERFTSGVELLTVNICQSGKAFVDWTYGDRQVW
jgi:hypothetical protein